MWVKWKGYPDKFNSWVSVKARFDVVYKYGVTILWIWSCPVVVTQYVEQDVSSPITRNHKDYIYLVNGTYKKAVNTSRSSEWWRMTKDLYGVVLEIMFPKQKLYICVKYCWFCPLSLLAFTIWPTNEVINNCGWHCSAVVWDICSLIHQSNHEWLSIDHTIGVLSHHVPLGSSHWKEDQHGYEWNCEKGGIDLW